MAAAQMAFDFALAARADGCGALPIPEAERVRRRASSSSGSHGCSGEVVLH